jgi:hypothetical protein
MGLLLGDDVLNVQLIDRGLDNGQPADQLGLHSLELRDAEQSGGEVGPILLDWGCDTGVPGFHRHERTIER